MRHHVASLSLESMYAGALGEGTMTYAIHASRDGRSVVTIRISPAVAVEKARALEELGWQVHVTDSAGHQYDPQDFDRLSSFFHQMASTIN